MKRVTSMMCCLTLGCAAFTFSHTAKAQASDQDKQFLTNASQGNYDEIQIAKMAEQKATNPAVKSFAHRMVTDHTRLGEKMQPFATEWGLSAPAGLSADGQKEFDDLNGRSGNDFDKKYIDDMVSDHTKVLDDFTKEVKDTHDAKFKVAVEQGKSVVAAHKNMAYDLKKKM